MNEVNLVSSISFKEMIELRSTLHALSNREFICSVCKTKNAHRSDAKFMFDKVKKQKGCDYISPNQLHSVVQGDLRINYNTCIGNFFSDSCVQWIQTYNHFERGVMPFQGGYMDQPAKVIDIMNVIGSHKESEIKKQAQKQNQLNRGNVRTIKRG